MLMRHTFSFFTTLCLIAGALTGASAQTENAKPSSSGNGNNKGVTIFAAGDIADCRKQSAAASTAELVMAGLAKDRRGYALTLGDNTYPIGRPEEFNDCYDRSWGKFKKRTLPSPGNHDYGVPLALGYYNYFDDLAGPDRRGYYRKAIGNWQLYSLNSNIKGQQMQEQLEWLKEELKENKSSCTLAFWHHPLIASGGHGDNDIMKDAWEILAEAKADIVLASHDHNYERMVPLNANGEPDEKNGIRSFVVGTGGVKLTPMFFSKATTAVRDNTSHGVLKLTLHANSYEWQFLPIAGHSFTDKGRDTCHR